MGDSWWPGRSRPDDVVSFVDPPQEHVAEVDRPDPVGDLLEADGMLLERVGDEEQAPLEAKGAGIGDALDDEVPGIFDRRQGAGVLAGGGPVERCRRPALQELVGALVVVLAAESIERPLLRGERGPGRPNRLALQRLVHPLVGPVLLGVGRQDPLVLNAQAEPLEFRGHHTELLI